MKTRRVLGGALILLLIFGFWRATLSGPGRSRAPSAGVAAGGAAHAEPSHEASEAPAGSVVIPVDAGARAAWPAVFSPVNFEPGPPVVGRVVRATLTPEELGALQPVIFDLQLRHREELLARVQRGEVLTPQELKARYLPPPEEWERVAAWARDQGLAIQDAGFSRLAVSATGTVAQVQTAMQMKFGRVIGTDGAEYTSAITAPALPNGLRPALVAVSGLQPHFKPLPHTISTVRQVEYTINPTTIADFYNATGLGLDGEGQTIAVLGGSMRVADEDMADFWQVCGIPTTLAQLTRVKFQEGMAESEHIEATMDLQWASAMAPKASFVLLGTLDPSIYGPWIVDQIAGGRSISQVTGSFGLTEALSWPEASLVRDEQYFAVLASLGVTVFASSGDAGSTENVKGASIPIRGYFATGALAPEYPSSSPWVTAVGGTTLAFTYGNSAENNGFTKATTPVAEGAWTLFTGDLPENPERNGGYASGGGVSWYFDRPAWQTGAGIPGGAKRCVPDVAAVAASNVALYVRWHGQTFFGGGTSLSTPLWAGLCALINQARAKEGRAPLGLLGPRIYPLLNTPCFNPMPVGCNNGTDPMSPGATNGAYKVGPDYTLIAGLGSPNLDRLVEALKSVGPVREELSDLARLSARPPAFDAAGYLARNPDVAQSIGEVADKFDRAWAHYVSTGIYEGRTDGDFDVRAYMAQYPEVQAMYNAVHLEYLARYWYWYGRTTGQRIPAGFDVAGYLARNRDIAAAFGNDKYGAWLHYYNYGVFEGRSFDANFIPAEYLELNQDLKRAGGGDLKGAVMHWLSYGHPVEDRMGRVPIGFNVDNYLARYPDLAAGFAGITPVAVRNVAVWQHFLDYGAAEGRSDGDFDIYSYLAGNPDVAVAVNHNPRSAALHWFFYGRREGRRIPGGFNVQNYRTLYPDLVVFGGDDLYGSWIHYRDVGVLEGRYYDDTFRPADYLALNPDIAAIIGNNYRDALLHWLYYGQYEGRSAKF